jgi:uncharacterized protein YegL
MLKRKEVTNDSMLEAFSVNIDFPNMTYETLRNLVNAIEVEVKMAVYDNDTALNTPFDELSTYDAGDVLYVRALEFLRDQLSARFNEVTKERPTKKIYRAYWYLVLEGDPLDKVTVMDFLVEAEYETEAYELSDPALYGQHRVSIPPGAHFINWRVVEV